MMDDLDSGTQYAMLKADIASLRAQLEAAREDSERLDWLQTNHTGRFAELTGFDLAYDEYLSGAESFRAAIDAARESEAGEDEKA